MGVQRISAAKAWERLSRKKDIILLDVRTKEEYREKHIPNSVLIPLDRLEKEVEERFPNKDVPIFVYCRSGRRSAIAGKIMTELGYQQVFDLGGILDWPFETRTAKQ